MSEYWSAIRRNPVMAGVWGLCVAIYLVFLPFHAWGTGDTETVIASIAPALACVRAGQFSGCDIHSAFPLLQFIPAVPLHMIGLSMHHVKGVLIMINLAASVGMFGLGIWLFDKDRRGLWLFFLILLCSPYWVYAIGSAGEPLAAFLTLLLVVLCIKRKPWWQILLAFVAAALTKETAAPFLFVLAMAAGPLKGWRLDREVRNHVFVLVAGAILAIGIGGLWNIFRYGVPWNVSYMSMADWNPNTLQDLRFFAALWGAPYAGLVTYWPAWTLSVFAIIFAARSMRGWLVALMMLFLTIGLCQWWAPFGWDSYGQRLTLPWLPASAALLLYYERTTVDRLLSLVTARNWRSWAVIAVFLLSTVPHLFVAQGWYAFHDALQAHNTATYPMLREHVNPDVSPAIYFRDVNLLMWAPDTNVSVIFEYGFSRFKYCPWLFLTLFGLWQLSLLVFKRDGNSTLENGGVTKGRH